MPQGGGKDSMEFEKLKEIIADVMNVDPEEITMDTTFVTDLGADSLDLAQIIMRSEKEFGVTVPMEKAEHVKTVREAMDLMQNAESGQ